jgi:hypothetical protein
MRRLIMYNLFLNEEKEIFNYSEGELREYKTVFYISKDDVYIPKNIVTEITQVETLPEDFEIGKYKYVNGEFVLNESYDPPQEENEPKE